MAKAPTKTEAPAQPAAEEPVVTEAQAAPASDPVDEVQPPVEGTPEAPAQPAAEEGAAEGGDEAEAEEADPIAEINAGLVAMAHPDGGTCDRYEQDAAGNILVPLIEVAEMADHGFVLATSGAE